MKPLAEQDRDRVKAAVEAALIVPVSGTEQKVVAAALEALTFILKEHREYGDREDGAYTGGWTACEEILGKRIKDMELQLGIAKKALEAIASRGTFAWSGSQPDATTLFLNSFVEIADTALKELTK